MHFLPRMILVLGVLAAPVAFAEDPALEVADGSVSPSGFEYQTGVVELPGGMARVELAEGFRYLGPAETRTVLENLGGAPPGDGWQLLGLVAASEENPEAPGACMAILSYAAEGHTSDKDMSLFNKQLFIEKLKGQNAAENEMRKAKGQPVIEFVDLLGQPFYSRGTKTFEIRKRFWNEGASSGEESILEREEWVLGRRGKIVIGTVEPTGRKNGPNYFGSNAIAEMVHFNPGHRHQDFDPKSDSRSKWPAAMQLTEAAEESKSTFVSLVKRKLPLLAFILVALLVKKGIDRFREA